MKAAKDGPPTAHVLLGGRSVPLVASMRAHYVIEHITGKPISEYLLGLSGGGLSEWFPLLYGLTATYRAQGGQQHTLTDEDKALGMVVPSSFVDTLPTGPAWAELKRVADELIASAWSDPEDDAGPLGPPAADSPVSIGTGESTRAE